MGFLQLLFKGLAAALASLRPGRAHREVLDTAGAKHTENVSLPPPIVLLNWHFHWQSSAKPPRLRYALTLISLHWTRIGQPWAWLPGGCSLRHQCTIHLGSPFAGGMGLRCSGWGVRKPRSTGSEQAKVLTGSDGRANAVVGGQHALVDNEYFTNPVFAMYLVIVAFRSCKVSGA